MTKMCRTWSARHSTDLATELGFGVYPGAVALTVERIRCIVTLGTDNCRAEHFFNCFKRVHYGKATFILFKHSLDIPFIRSAHTTAYSANLCRYMRYFVHTLVYVAYVRHKFCISYGYATIRWHTLSYVVYLQNPIC